jgi:CheY-like chemotaxis protein
LYNLIDNAIKFTETGSVGIVVREEELEHVNLISIDVEDTGVGIPAERLNDIFLDFSQGDPSVTRKFGGVGLGLTIARAIANKMGGDLTVQSAVGRGSIFTLQILLNRAAENISAQLSAGESQTISDSHLALDILVVEDNHVNQIITRKFLEKVHARVTLVNNGQEAIDLIREKHFDLILMDIQMPVMDGISATKVIRGMGGAYSAIPIIAVTANTIADRASCLDAGMNGFIMKPITGKMLFDEMKSHLQ